MLAGTVLGLVVAASDEPVVLLTAAPGLALGLGLPLDDFLDGMKNKLL
jgi:hypothetical protein